MSLAGSCLCGNLKYTIASEPKAVGICHCLDCKKATGSSFNTGVAVPRAAIKFDGEYKTYAKPATSGQNAVRYFCPNCGSTVANMPDINPAIAFILAGTLEPEYTKDLKPQMEIYTRSRYSFLTDRFGRQSEASPPPPPS